MEINKFHKEALQITLEAKARGAFGCQYSAERDLFEKDIMEIIEVGKEEIDKKDLEWVLDDCRFLVSQSLIQYL